MCITLLTWVIPFNVIKHLHPGLHWIFVYISCMKKHCQLLCTSPKICHENLFYLKVASNTCTKFWSLNNKQRKYPQNDLCQLKLLWHWPISCIKTHKNDLCLLNSPCKKEKWKIHVLPLEYKCSPEQEWTWSTLKMFLFYIGERISF